MTDSIETAKYTITGLVDFYDEQGNITGQFPIGSVQELPKEYGDKAVEDGRAELVAGSEAVSEVGADLSSDAAPVEGADDAELGDDSDAENQSGDELDTGDGAPVVDPEEVQ